MDKIFNYLLKLGLTKKFLNVTFIFFRNNMFIIKTTINNYRDTIRPQILYRLRLC